MARTVRVGGGGNLLAPGVDDELAFQRVALFLPAVGAPLFFLGRSIGVSVASMSTTVQSVFVAHPPTLHPIPLLLQEVY